MLPALIRWLFWRRGLLLCSVLFVSLCGLAVAIVFGGALAFIFGTGVTALAEIEATQLETMSIGLLVAVFLWVVALLAE